jgi:hypothetical protein
MKKRSDYYIYSDGEGYRGKSTGEVFHDIFRNNSWHITEGFSSRSGPGSEMEQTGAILEKIPEIFRSLGVHSFLDVPCGDFNWLKWLDWSNMQYLGGDIVPELAARNQRLYAKDNIAFRTINLIEDNLPEADMLFCRDCLVHFSFEDIRKTLHNIRRSPIKYFMSTTFPKESSNQDIITGGWRPLNMTLPPFDFPEPLVIVNEKCTEANGLFDDKSMACWLVRDL